MKTVKNMKPPNQPVIELDPSPPIHVVVDKGETDGFVAAEEGVESESKNHVRRRLVHLRELISVEDKSGAREITNFSN